MKKFLFAALFLVLSAQILFGQDSNSSGKGSEFCFQNKIHSLNIDPAFSITADIQHTFDAIDYKLNLDIYNCFISPYPKSFKGSVILTFQVDSDFKLN